MSRTTPEDLPQIAEASELLRARADKLREHLRNYIETDGRVGYLRDMTATGGSEVMLHLVLRTVGRKSGVERLIPLTYAAWGDEFVLVASKGGHEKHPDWFLNLTAHPEIDFQVRDKRYRGTWRIAEGEEREALWAYVSTYYKGYAIYQARTERLLPIVVLTTGEHIEEPFELSEQLMPNLGR